MSQTWSYMGCSRDGAHAMSQTWSYRGPLISVPTPCPRHGLTWDVLVMVPMPCPRHGLIGDLSSRCQRHVPDMVLHGTSRLGAHAMSQTWSYRGPLMILRMPMPCPRHGLTWDLFTQMS
ncbi:hypothetical protein V6Z11_A09G147600 [Gossypium hirsutum]